MFPRNNKKLFSLKNIPVSFSKEAPTPKFHPEMLNSITQKKRVTITI
uniref:Uncharacterized protein n=1 Tax=Arundo donax TaxID=35708 RepID=A0A0A8Y249_ARUDO